MKRPTTSDIIEAMIAGVTAGGLAIGFVALINLGSDTGNALAFLGGIVGAGLAVLGAIWVEHRRRTDFRDRERGMLLQQLEHWRPLLSEQLSKLKKMPDVQTPEMRLAALTACIIMADMGGIAQIGVQYGTALNLLERMRLLKLAELSGMVKDNTAADNEDVDIAATIQVADFALQSLDYAIAEIELNHDARGPMV